MRGWLLTDWLSIDFIDLVLITYGVAGWVTLGIG